MVLLLWCQIVLLWHHVTMVASEQHLYKKNSTIWQNNCITQKTCNRKYTWLPLLLLLPSGYYVWGTENCKWCVSILKKCLVHSDSRDNHQVFITNIAYKDSNGNSNFPSTPIASGCSYYQQLECQPFLLTAVLCSSRTIFSWLHDVYCLMHVHGVVIPWAQLIYNMTKVEVTRGWHFQELLSLCIFPDHRVAPWGVYAVIMLSSHMLRLWRTPPSGDFLYDCYHEVFFFGRTPPFNIITSILLWPDFNLQNPPPRENGRSTNQQSQLWGRRDSVDREKHLWYTIVCSAINKPGKKLIRKIQALAQELLTLTHKSHNEWTLPSHQWYNSMHPHLT